MGSSPVVMVVEWNVPPGQAWPVTTALQGVMLSTRRQRGFLGCSLATDVGERVTLHYEESWATQEDLEQQVRSERFAMLARLIESATQPPRVEFALPTGTRGLDYVFELRRNPSGTTTRP
jgi:quinol monooxygenase YgiN